MKRSLFLLMFSGLSLAACTGPVIMGTDAAVTVATKPWGEPPADTAHQIPEHETWCYGTMAQADCYAHPQDVQPSRLINVDPQNRYPLDAHDYREMINARNGATNVPTNLEPAAAMPVEKDMAPLSTTNLHTR